jgi:hypothetical protein
MPPTATQSGTVTFQGIEVPAQSVNPSAFFALTRRHRNQEVNRAFAGLGLTDHVELKKSDIISGLTVQFSGSLVVTSTPTMTMRWPYDLVRAFRFTANGQTNLINASGLQIKARSFMRPGCTDRGVSQTVGAATKTQGTLSTASESWGVAPAKQLAAGTYDVELEYFIPVAEDPADLAGSIFAQTSTMDLNLDIDWEQPANLVDTVADITLTGNVKVTTEKYSIPVVGGNFVVPDLSMFHSITSARKTDLATGENEVRLTGQGAGKQLLRLYYRVLNGSPLAPLAANATNYGPQGWRYGTNETPEVYGDGLIMRMINEGEYGCDLGGVWGWLAHEFNVTNAFRDTVDMGQTSELRLVTTIGASVDLSSPVLEYVQETMFAAAG